MIEVFIDLRRPNAYLAIAPTQRLASSLQLELQWLPCQLPLHKAPPPAPSNPAAEPVSERHKRTRQHYRDSIAARYAEWAGLPLRQHRPAIDMGLWSAALLRQQSLGKAEEFVAQSFAAYWGGSTEALNLAELLGVTPQGLSEIGAQFADRVAEVDRRAEELGLIDAPGYVVQGELFVGREHLPMVRHIALEGVPY